MAILAAAGIQSLFCHSITCKKVGWLGVKRSSGWARVAHT